MTEAATIQEASDATEDLADGNDDGIEIEQGESRILHEAAQQGKDDAAEQNGTVEHETAFPDAEDPEPVAGIVVPVFENVGQTGTGDTGKDEDGRQCGQAFGMVSASGRQFLQDDESAKDSDCHAKAVRMECKTP